MTAPIPWRRHLATCPHATQGRSWTDCRCPIWVDMHPPGQPRIRKSLQTSDWRRAMSRIGILQSGQDWLPPDKTSATLHQAAKQFLQDARARHLEASTVAVYDLVLRHFLAFAGSGRALSAITVETIGEYRAQRKVAASTQRKEIEKLRAFFTWCVDRNFLPGNPAKKVRLPQVEELTTLPFSAEEVRRLLAACERLTSDNPAEIPAIRQRARAIVLVLLYSGLRVSDVTRLRRSALEASGHLVLRTQKNQAPIKVLLGPDAIRALEQLPALDGNPEYFFWSGKGQPITCTKNIRRTIRRLGLLAGKIHAHPHRFRDTFAVELLTHGADIRTVQLLLGHKSVRTTEKHYAHFVAAHQALLDAAAARLQFTKAARPLPVKPLRQRKRNP